MMAKPNPGAKLISKSAASYWTGLTTAQINKAVQQKIIKVEKRGNGDFMDFEAASDLYRMRDSIEKL